MSIIDKIRSADDLNSELYEIPKWDVTILIRSMSARERATYASFAAADGASPEEMAQSAMQRVEGLWSKVLISCCFDPDTGENIFNEESVDWLFAEKDGEIVSNLAMKCLTVSGLGGDSADDAGKDSWDLQIVEDADHLNDESTSG